MSPKQVVENINDDKAFLAKQANDVDRLETLVYLYLHNLEKDFDAYKQSLYMLAIKDLNCKSENRPEIWKIVSEEYAIYDEKKEVLKSKLEKLVK